MKLTPEQVQQIAVPQGYKLVPIEPTTAMIVAIEDKVDSQLAASGIHPTAMQRQDGEHIYSAMLAAAPNLSISTQKIDTSARCIDAVDVMPDAAAPYDVVFKAIAASTTVAGNAVAVSVAQFYTALLSSGYTVRAPLPLTAGLATPDDLNYNAQRLRNVANLVGLEGAIPDDDATLDGARGAVLGMIAGRLRGESAIDKIAAAPVPQVQLSEALAPPAAAEQIDGEMLVLLMREAEIIYADNIDVLLSGSDLRFTLDDLVQVANLAAPVGKQGGA